MTERTKIIIVRHGECLGNIEQRVRGRSDFPLNGNGLAQARAAAEALKDEKLKCVYTSPLNRALKTAEIIAAAARCPVKSDERFNNMSYGVWEGRKNSDIAREFPAEWRLWLTYPENLRIDGAESFDDAAARSFAALRELTELHSGEVFAIVSHRGLIKPMLCETLEIAKPRFWKLYVDNASISALVHSGETGYTLTALNITSHLKIWNWRRNLLSLPFRAARLPD